MANVTWTATGSSSWNQAANWNSHIVPAQGSSVFFTQDGGSAYTASILTNPFTLAALTINDRYATLAVGGGNGSRSLSVTTTSGAGVITATLGSLTMAVSGDVTQTNQLTVNGGTVMVGTGTKLDVLVAGTPAVASTAALSAGTIDASASTAVFDVGATSSTAGTNINSSLGTLNVSNLGTLKTTALNVSAGQFTQAGGSIIASGTVGFTGGSDAISGGELDGAGITVGTALTLSGGTLKDTSASANVAVSSGATLTMSGGTLDGSSDGIAVSGVLSGRGTVKGVISGTGTVLATGGLFDLTSAAASLTGIHYQIGTGASALEFASSVASGNTATFNGTSGTLELGSSSFSGIVAGLKAATTANSSTGTGVIDLLNSGSITGVSIVGGTTLHVVANTSTYNIATSGTNFTGDFINYASDGSQGELIWVDQNVCYTAGTHILTPHGEIPVEDLAAGASIITLENGQHVPRPIKWIGRRHLDLTRHPKPATAAPVRIARNAFADNLPHRDLVVSPDHSLFIDGGLIPAKLLINGTTIVQDRSARSVTYYHIELDHHAILLAEGVPAESYLDTGNRAFFENAGLALVLHPEFEVNAHLKVWEEDACAPLTLSPEAVGPIWRRLAERARSLGYAAPGLAQTADPDVHLLADGRAMRPIAVDGGRHVFMLPAGAHEVRVASRASLPLELVPYHDDPRPLGVAVSRIKIRSGASLHDIPLDHPALTQGWHRVERAGGRTWRWTNGNAALPITPAKEALILEMQLHPMPAYRLPGSGTPARLAA